MNDNMNDNINDIIENINNSYNIIKKNQIILENKSNDDFNLLLDYNKTLIIENCENITITISKITQILIINCNNIVINYNKPVIGFFISKSKIIKLNEIITNNTDITYEFSNSYNIDVNQYYNNNNNIFIIIYCDEVFINKRSIFINFFDSCCLIIKNNITYF
jgi:hypothetical protein